MRNSIESAWAPRVLDSATGMVLPQRRENRPFLLKTELAIKGLEPKAQKLFTDLLEESQFAQAVGELRTSRRHSLRRQFVGFVGEIITFRYLEKTIKDKEILLSPWETDELYASLYPERVIVSGFHKTLRGLTVPDGLLFTRVGKIMLITTAFEYSLTQEFDSQKQKQTKYYSRPDSICINLIGFNNPFQRAYLAEWLRGRYPDVPSQVFADLSFRFISVFPRSDSSANRNEEQSSSDRRTIFLPVSRKEFSLVFDGIFEDVKNSLETEGKS